MVRMYRAYVLLTSATHHRHLCWGARMESVCLLDVRLAPEEPQSTAAVGQRRSNVMDVVGAIAPTPIAHDPFVH